MGTKRQTLTTSVLFICQTIGIKEKKPNDFQNRKHKTKPKLLARVLTALTDGEASVTVANELAIRRAL
jgi:hypothetical protein